MFLCLPNNSHPFLPVIASQTRLFLRSLCSLGVSSFSSFVPLCLCGYIKRARISYFVSFASFCALLPSSLCLCASVVISNMPARARLALRVAAFEEEPRFLVAALVHIVQQVRRSRGRQRPGEFVQTRKDRAQIGLRIRGRHRRHRRFQRLQRRED